MCPWELGDRDDLVVVTRRLSILIPIVAAGRRKVLEPATTLVATQGETAGLPATLVVTVGSLPKPATTLVVAQGSIPRPATTLVVSQGSVPRPAASLVVTGGTARWYATSLGGTCGGFPRPATTLGGTSRSFLRDSTTMGIGMRSGPWVANTLVYSGLQSSSQKWRMAATGRDGLRRRTNGGTRQWTRYSGNASL